MASAPAEQILERLADELCSPEPSGTPVSELGVFFNQHPAANDEGAIMSAILRTDDALGIASWALSPLYRVAKARIDSSRHDMRAAAAMLAVNPDFLTAWGVRKRCLIQEAEGGATKERIEHELKFCALILTRGPKSAETWSHRSWVLRVFGWDEDRAAIELALGWRAASASFANYYAGVQRLRALDHASLSIIVSEIHASRKWLEQNVSDSSGWWYHAKLAQRLLGTSPNSQVDFEQEREFAEDMLNAYGEQYECLRKYHKWLQNRFR